MATRRWTTCFAVAIAATILGHPPACEAQSKSLPAIVAEMEGNRTVHLADGNKLHAAVKATLYRDEQGRTRVEQGSTVTITDPVARETLMLDTARKSVRKFLHSAAAAAGRHAIGGPTSGYSRPLGRKVIDGIEVVGKAYDQVIPAGSSIGNVREVRRTSEVWFAEEVGLPLKIVIRDAIAGDTITTYRILQRGVPLHRSLFVAPEDYVLHDGNP
jgi:hypothetical protein